MSGRRGGAPQRPQGEGEFQPPGRMLFSVTFNIEAATAVGFNQFIERVRMELLDLIQGQRHYGRGTQVLPCPQAEMTWFTIVLVGRDRETEYSVPFYIEAETIYLHGYQNQNQNPEERRVFEFKPESGSILRGKSKPLGFGCNYIPLTRATEHKVKGSDGKVHVQDPGYTLEHGKEGVPMPDFCQSRLNTAVRELAQADNSGSQHRTAQNLLLVIIRFCESIRNRSVQREMVDLWDSAHARSSSLSTRGVGQIKNWNGLASNLQDSARHLVIWPSTLAKTTGVRSAAEAQEILVLIKFIGYPNEPANPTPVWKKPPPDNHRRHGGGGGAAGGVSASAAELPRWCLVPEEPVMQVLAVEIPAQRGARRLDGVYGNISVTDGFGTQAIYNREWDYFQRNSGDSGMTLELDALNHAISAYDCVDIDVDLGSVSPAAPLAKGLVSWSVHNCRTNSYDHVVRTRIGPAVLEYIVYSKAVQVAVRVTVDNATAVDSAWFTTMNTMVGALLPPQGRYMTRTQPGRGLRGEYIVAVPLSSRLEVVVKAQYKGSRQPVATTFELQPTGDGGSTTSTRTLQQGVTLKVNFAWNLVRMGSANPVTSSSGWSKDPSELRR